MESYDFLYKYDRYMPLNSEVNLLNEEKHYIVYKVYYNSVNSVRVPSLFIVPKAHEEKYPCLIFLHGYGGRKEDALKLADIVAKEGYAILSIDAPYHGERKVSGKVLYSPNLEETKRNFIQTVIDLRRGVDFLETRSEVDKTRLGYVGGSMGGILGAIFIGIEERIKVAVLVVAGGNLPLMIEKSQHPAVPPIRRRIKELGLTYEDVRRIVDPVDPLNFIYHFSPKPLQFHLGIKDRIVPAEAGKLLVERAGEPKEVYWYDTGHNVPLDIVVARSLDFFDRYLKNERPLLPREFKLRLLGKW